MQALLTVSNSWIQIDFSHNALMIVIVKILWHLNARLVRLAQNGVSLHSEILDAGTYGRTICEKFDVNRTIKSVRGRSGSHPLR